MNTYLHNGFSYPTKSRSSLDYLSEKFEKVIEKSKPLKTNEFRNPLLKDAKNIVQAAINSGLVSLPKKTKSTQPLSRKKCNTCKKEFKLKKANQLYCSRECVLKSHASKKKAKSKAKRITANCKICKKSYIKRNGRLTCSDECKIEYVKKNKCIRWRKTAKKNAGNFDKYNHKIDLACRHLSMTLIELALSLGFRKNALRDWRLGKGSPNAKQQRILAEL